MLLNDLDEWSLMNILDFLEFGDLLAISTVNPTFDHLVTNHFMVQKFRIHERAIYISSKERLNEISNNNRITIGSMALGQEFLEKFGHLFTHLILSPQRERNVEIRRIIEQYCAETLSEFELINSSSYFLSETNQTFNRLVKLSYTIIEPRQIPQFSRIYPALKELSVDTHGQIGGKLEHITKMIKAAPGLRAFAIDHIPAYETFRLLNDNHPNIESLKFGYRSDVFRNNIDTNTINFNNVKELTINRLDGFVGRNLFPLRFDRVQKLEIHTKRADSIPFVIIERGVELKTLSLINLKDMWHVLTILYRVNETHSIENVSLSWANDTTNRPAQLTTRLLSDYPKLQSVTFYVMDSDDSMNDRNALLAVIHGHNQWNIERVNSNIVRGCSSRESLVSIKRQVFEQ